MNPQAFDKAEKWTGPKQPENPDATIWRYMDFVKFVSLLEDSSLVFSRREGFNDPYEGAYTHVAHEYPAAYAEHFTQERIEQQHADALRDRRWEMSWFYINCWHMNESESEAMWKLYAGSAQSIAVRSTYSRLKNQLPTENASIGEVSYRDYNSETLPGQGSPRNMLSPFFHKRLAFAHEKEVRAVISRIPKLEPNRQYSYDELEALPQPPIIKVPVNLDELVCGVYIAPAAPKWFADLVQKMLSRYHYTFGQNIHQSELDTEPNFVPKRVLPTITSTI